MLKLRVLGSLGLVRDDGVEVRSVLAQPKRTALLVYLAVDRPGAFRRRDTLLGLFWPERPPDHARNALNQSLHFLRRSLGSGVIETRGREEVGLADDELWCDAAAFREEIEGEAWQRALELYRGDLLEGFHVSGVPAFERWMDRKRMQLREAARDAALAQAEDAETADETRQWLQRALEIVPTDEPAVRRLMTLQDDAGDRAGALRAYDVLATRLERTVGTEPSPETQGLARKIRQGRRRSDASGTPAGADDDGASAPRDASRTTEPSSPEQTEAPEPAGARRRWTFAAAALLVAAAAMLLLFGSDPGIDGSPSGPGASAESIPRGLDRRETLDPRTVAVLPFDDLSPGRPDDHFSDGLAEELLHHLARSPGLKVVARTSSFRFGGTALDVRAIGDSLGAGSVLEGSVRRSGDRIRITAQLIDAGDAHHLWAGSYDVRLRPDALFEVQEEIATAIADTLRVRLDGGPGPGRAELPTSDLEAYSLYLRGRRAWNRRTPESFRKAVELYEAALARDSAFARSWAGLAELYAIVPTSPNVSPLIPEFVTREEARRRTREAAERALALDEDMAPAHAAVGQLLRGVDGDRRAEAAFRRAIELNPSYSTARQWLAFLLATQGRTDEALDQMRTARLLDPFSVSINGDLGRFLYYAGEHDEAVRRLRRALELGTYPQAEQSLARALSAAGRHEEARDLASRLDAEVHGAQRVRTIRGVVAARSGRDEVAREILARWKRKLEAEDGPFAAGEIDQPTALNIARLHAALGERDSARSWLDRVDGWGPGGWLQIRNDPLLTAVRPDTNLARDG
jgi:TolB-like protein/DNA-binding SARP family transcriptional activator/Flp pilus assembly protein TadD